MKYMLLYASERSKAEGTNESEQKIPSLFLIKVVKTNYFKSFS